MGADEIARVRDRITTEHLDMSHGVQGVDTIEATSLVRSALASGISQRDIAAAIRASTGLSTDERSLLNRALEAAPQGSLGPVPPPFGLPFMGTLTLVNGAETTRVAYSGIAVHADREHPDPRFGSAVTGVSMSLTSVSGTDSAVRIRAFDCVLAMAYGLDNEAVRRAGTDERVMFERLLLLPEIAAARTAYSENQTPLSVQERCFIPTPTLPMAPSPSPR